MLGALNVLVQRLNLCSLQLSLFIAMKYSKFLVRMCPYLSKFGHDLFPSIKQTTENRRKVLKSEHIELPSVRIVNHLKNDMARTVIMM